MNQRLSLLVAAGALLLSGIHLLQETVTPPIARADGETQRRLYIEPGTHMIPTLDGGSSYGKIVTDLETGETWGFPTQGKSPYPGYQVSKNEPLTVNAVYLGRWNLSSLDRRQRPRTTQTP